MIVGVARLTLALGQARSLKDKRQVVRRIVDRVRARFPVSVAEVDAHDLWQKAVLGIAMVGNDGGHVREVLDAALRDVEELYVAPVVDIQVRLVSMDDLEGAGWHGEGPDPFTREILAGEPEPEPEDDEIEDAPWATPPRRRS